MFVRSAAWCRMTGRRRPRRDRLENLKFGLGEPKTMAVLRGMSRSTRTKSGSYRA